MAVDSRRRGFSLLESLIASVVMAVSITGMVSLWTIMFARYSTAREITQAAQLARAEVERAKVFGVSNLPLGTYNSTTLTASWTGTFDPTANSGAGGWTSAGTSYFDLY